MHQETLTGFKWLANHGLRLEADGHHVLLAFEEAIGAPTFKRNHLFSYTPPTLMSRCRSPALARRAGYMANPAVKDKDGISAAMVLAHLIRDVYGRGSTLVATLEDLYKQYA